MEQVLEFLLHHIEMVVFFTVLAEQIGLPLPAIPVLLAAGAVAGDGQASLTLVTALSVAACLLGDMVWFELGRHRGRQTLTLLCRIALEPDACQAYREFLSDPRYPGAYLRQVYPGLEHTGPRTSRAL
jgi:membrane protein DedA with SNARE-associated domain